MDKEIIELTKEEGEMVKTYQDNVAKTRSALGSFRQQYLASEQKAIENIDKAESEYLSYVKTLSQSKSIAIGSEKWVFEPEKLLFRKIT